MKLIRNILTLSAFGFVAAGTAGGYIYYKHRNTDIYSLPLYDRSKLFSSSEQVDLPRDEQNHVILHTDRNEQLEQLNNNFDIIIIGGGSVGSSSALEASSRGLKVLLLERNDFSSGTSSRSTKLLHGGVRYLEKAIMNADWNELQLVYDCLRERKHFFQVCPHLSSPMLLITPCYSLFDSVKMFIGLTIYDVLSGSDARIGYARWFSKKSTIERWPSLKKSGLLGAMSYYDGSFNDSRANLLTILTANALGTVTLNYMEVTELLKSEEGKLVGVRVKDRLSGQMYSVSSKCVVNATGPYLDQIRLMDDPNAQLIVKPSAGTHLVFDKDKFMSENQHSGILVPKTKDGRVLFLVPWEGKLLAGTTDIPTPLTETPNPTTTELEFIVETMKECLEGEISTKDIKSSWTGIRPLISVPSALAENNSSAATKTISRDHYIEMSKSGLISVGGGKWTSYRKIGEDTIEKALHEVFMTDQKEIPKSKTNYICLVGSSVYWEALKKIDTPPLSNISKETWDHLKHYYGDRALFILNISQQYNLLNKLSDKYPFIEGEILYQLKYEMAMKPLDIIAYRLSLMFLDREESKNIAPKVIDIMSKELQWNEERKQKELQETLNYINVCTK
ncbi:hypothetical protein ABK040_011542 [Willaertia magna]